MGKSFKRMQHKQRIAERLAQKEIVYEQIVEVKPESKVVPVVEVPKVEIIEIVELDDEEEEVQISTEELAKSVLQAQSKKGAQKKK